VLFIFIVYVTLLSVTDIVALNKRLMVNNELERLWKEVVVVCCKVLSQNLRGVTEDNHGKPQSG
jgi:hypothetical protein